MPQFNADATRYSLESPTLAPQAAGFLWNRRMMIQATCRGYAVAQFMQPEPAKYAHVPTLAGTSFMQPEQPYFAHHPGRFFYVRDDHSGDLFSAPYEPMRAPLDQFEFNVGLSDLSWKAARGGLVLEQRLTLTEHDVVELWTVRLTNQSTAHRKVSLFSYFPVGYSSWMNLGGHYDPELCAAVATSVAPYQKTADYFKRREWKDITCLMSDLAPTSWELRQSAFEGEGGLHRPSALAEPALGGGEAHYELPACCLHFAFALAPGETREVRLVFGPAKDRAELLQRRQELLASPGAFERAADQYAAYVRRGRGVVQIKSPDATFDAFVNNWLPRQVYYHGDTNRLTTDPQTRNFLQDAMGMAFVDPEVTRKAMRLALSQQKADGEMPDGVLLYPGAELKYINQIPHTDHGVWFIICLSAYLNETGDHALLDEQLEFSDSKATASVYEHLCLSLEHLLKARDERGLSYIGQGDWCDPMNMVGYKGRGVSGWLTEALSFALQQCLPLCLQRGDTARQRKFADAAEQLNRAINRYFWDGKWFGRGITDDGVLFGVQSDTEGRVFLNAQSWAMLCRAASTEQVESMLQAIDLELSTPFGVQLCGPAYTRMREDVGRVTQKFPGSAENGSVYNHAAAFYAAGLYSIGQAERAYEVLRKMVPGPDLADLAQRGQLPVYVPNYYRGAYRQLPRTAGRSSQLFNTGTAAWYYRMVTEELVGLKGDGAGLKIEPKIPAAWQEMRATRRFRGATIELEVRRGGAGLQGPEVVVDGRPCPERRLPRVEPGRSYAVTVRLP